MQFIARVLAGEDEMTVLCREYGVSRKTGYKWLGGISRRAARVWQSARTRRCSTVRRITSQWCKRCWDCASAGRTEGQRSCG